MAPRVRGRMRRAVLVGVLAVFAGCGANVYLALRPESLKLRVARALATVFESGLTFSSLEVGWNGSVEVRNLELSGESGVEGIAKVRGLRIRPRFAALLRGRYEPGTILLDGVELEIVRGRDGRWNLERLLRPGTGGGRTPPPDIVIRDLRVHYSDAYTFTRPCAYEIEGVAARVASVEPDVLAVEAELTGASCPDLPARRLVLTCRVTLKPEPVRIDARLEVAKLDLSRPIEHLLPLDLAGRVRTFNVRGIVDDLSADLHYSAQEGLRIGNAGGRLLRCEFAPPELPFPVKGLSGPFHYSKGVLDVGDLTGEFAGGRVHLKARMRLTPGARGVQDWSGRVQVDALALDRRLEAVLPPALARIMERFRPEGKIGLDLQVRDAARIPPRLEDLRGAVELQGLALEFHKFPYRVEDVRGTLTLKQGRLDLSGAFGRTQDAVVRTSGWIELGKGGALEARVHVEGEPGLPLDARFRAALPLAVRDLWDNLQPQGRVTGEIKIEARRAAGENPAPGRERVVVTVNVREGRIVYRRFPYPISSIEGTIVFDSRRRIVEILSLEGRHNGHTIRAEGAVDLRARDRFALLLKCDDLQVDEALLAALPPEGRKAVEDFGFGGRLRTAVDIYREPRSPVAIDTRLEILEGSLRPKKFPYLLQLEGGKLHLRGTHFIDFVGIRAYRDIPAAQGTSDSGAVRVVDAVATGSFHLEGTERRLSGTLDVAKVRVDEELTRALPRDARRFFENFGLRGTFNGRLKMDYVFDEADPSAERIAYEASDVRTDDAQVDFGLRFREMSAEGAFAGGWRAGDVHRFEGRIFVHRTWFNRLRLTAGDIHFTYGSLHPLVSGGAGAEGGYRPPEAFVRRLRISSPRDTFQMSVHSSDLYGGKVDGFLFVETGPEGALGGDFAGEGLLVARAARDVFGVDARRVTGKARGYVRFEGRTRDVRSIRGRGLGVIEDARLVELPLFLGLLSVLNLDWSGAVDGAYFNEVRIPYEIRDGRFVTNDLEILSPGIKLRGGGTMDFKGNLDLSLEPRVFNFSIPLIEQIFSLIKKGLATVHVGGDLSDPLIELRTALFLRIPIKPSPPPEVRLPRDLRSKD